MGDPENNISDIPEATPSEASEPPIETTQPEAATEPVAVATGDGPFYGTGRRKTSVARVYLRPGSGRLLVNGHRLEEVFSSPQWREHARGALIFSGVAEQFDAEISVKGGGISGQAGAIRLGVARALILANPTLRPRLRQNGYLTRDPRMKERKKYGQKGARKRFQWTKR